MSKPFIRKVFRDYKYSMVWYSVILLLYTAMLIGFYPTVRENSADFEDLLDAYPEGLAEAFGITDTSLNTMEGFISLEFFSLMWVLIISILIYSLGASLVASEVDSGTSEFTFALPIRRRNIVLSRFVASFIIVVGITILTFASIILGAQFIDEDISKKGFSAFFLLSLSLSFFMLAMTSMLSTFFSSKGRVYAVCGGVFLVSYLLHIAHGITDTLDWLYHVSFFKYYGMPEEVLLNAKLDYSNLAMFLIVGIVFLAVSMYQSEKRDL